MASVIECFFTIGNHTKVARNSGVVLQQDGFIASLMAGILVTSVFVGGSLSRYITRELDKFIDIDQVHIGLLVLLSVNIVGLLVVMFQSKRRQTSVDAVSAHASRHRSPPPQTWRKTASSVILLIGLLIFLLGILLESLSLAFAYVMCLATTTHCYQQRALSYSVVAYFLLKCIFCVCIYLFICMHSSPKYRWRRGGSRAVRYLLCLTVACMLFLYYNQEAFFLLRPAEYFDFCELEPRLLTRDEQCVCGTTPEFTAAFRLGDRVAAFYVEFFLLASERLLHLFSSMSSCSGEADDVLHDAAGERAWSSSLSAPMQFFFCVCYNSVSV